MSSGLIKKNAPMIQSTVALRETTNLLTQAATTCPKNQSQRQTIVLHDADLMSRKRFWKCVRANMNATLAEEAAVGYFG